MAKVSEKTATTVAFTVAMLMVLIWMLFRWLNAYVYIKPIERKSGQSELFVPSQKYIKISLSSRYSGFRPSNPFRNHEPQNVNL